MVFVFQTEKQIRYDITYMQNLKYGKISLSTKQKQILRRRDCMCDRQGLGWRVGLGVWG